MDFEPIPAANREWDRDHAAGREGPAVVGLGRAEQFDASSDPSAVWTVILVRTRRAESSAAAEVVAYVRPSPPGAEPATAYDVTRYWNEFCTRPSLQP